MSAEQYQLSQMQFELVSLWRGIQERELAKAPDVQATLDPTHENEIVVVSLPFSSFQLNPSLAEYLNLTDSQISDIQQAMEQEKENLEPVMAELRFVRDKLIAIASKHLSEKEVKAPARREATLLGKLIVANARMQSHIYKVLTPDQQKKLHDLEQTPGAATTEAQ